jgi:hypothetical protein
MPVSMRWWQARPCARSSINIEHHYVSEAGVAKLTALGIDVNAKDRRRPEAHRGEEHRYIAVSE